MVLVLGEIRTLARLKQEISSKHFKDHASKTPYICSGIVLNPEENLGF